jgi:hypothetical protein
MLFVLSFTLHETSQITRGWLTMTTIKIYKEWHSTLLKEANRGFSWGDNFIFYQKKSHVFKSTD